MKTAINILVMVSVSLFTLSCSYDESEKIENVVVIPKTANTIIKSNETDIVRLIDLSDIPYALEEYKIKYRRYPISSNQGIGWDGFHSQYGESRPDWIKGLVPEFLSHLPKDPRLNDSGSQQYLYKSNGAHYKLLAHSPDDCGKVLELFPQLVDPVRNCWAYGYWTPKARVW